MSDKYTVTGFCSQSVVCIWYLRCDDQEFIVLAALHASLSWVSEAEGSAGSSDLSGAVDVAELVELNLILRQVVI